VDAQSNVTDSAQAVQAGMDTAETKTCSWLLSQAIPMAGHVVIDETTTYR
jgi:hypothetical protein